MVVFNELSRVSAISLHFLQRMGLFSWLELNLLINTENAIFLSVLIKTVHAHFMRAVTALDEHFVLLE